MGRRGEDKWSICLQGCYSEDTYYKVTHQVGPNLPLSSKQKLCLSIKGLYWIAPYVLMSTGGWDQPDESPCTALRIGRKSLMGLWTRNGLATSFIDHLMGDAIKFDPDSRHSTVPLDISFLQKRSLIRSRFLSNEEVVLSSLESYRKTKNICHANRPISYCYNLQTSPCSLVALEIQCNPLIRSTFCPRKVDHISGLILYPGY